MRGSIPSPGPGSVRFGGNTSCVELVSRGERLILDAGTGIRGLGKGILTDGGPDRIHILLTHFHWDHIQGLPFFAPLFDPRFEVTLIGPRQVDGGIRELLEAQMAGSRFPVPFSGIRARVSFVELNEGEWEEGGFQVRADRVSHPSFTVGYRIRAGGRSICYLPDHEVALRGGGAGSPAPYSAGPTGMAAWRPDPAVESLVSGADLLIHDAMYTEDEYPARRGWGHSTFEQAYTLAERAGVRSLLLFHHAPDRSDEELTAHVARLAERAEGEGGPRVEGAAEGRILPVGEG